MWEIVPGSHTMHCCDPIQPFWSDSANFSWDYRLLAAIMDENDPVLDKSSAKKRSNHVYKVTLDQWKSGLGEKFDEIVLGKKENLARIARDDKKRLKTKQALSSGGETFALPGSAGIKSEQGETEQVKMLTRNRPAIK